MEEQKKQNQEEQTGQLDIVPMLSCCGGSSEYLSNDPAPFAWRSMAIATLKLFDDAKACEDNPRIAWRYIYDCQAYATVKNGERTKHLPTYTAAVELTLNGSLATLMLVKSNALLNQLRREFGPGKLKMDDGRTLTEIIGQYMEVEVVNAHQKLLPHSDGVFANWNIFFNLGWSNQKERDEFMMFRKLSSGLAKALAPELGLNLAEIGGDSTMAQGVDYHIVLEDGVELTVHYAIVAPMSNVEALCLIRKDVITNEEIQRLRAAENR